MSDQLNIESKRQATLKKLKNKPSFTYSITKEDLEKRETCTVCNQSNLETISSVSYQKDYVFFQTSTCKHCGHVFRSIFPGFKWFTRCWDLIARQNSGPYNIQQEESRTKRYQSYLSKTANLMNSNNQPLNILEVGAGYGHGINVFKEAGHNIHVIEAEKERREYIQKTFDIDVIGETILDLKNKPNKYDIIIFSHCLEHVDNMKNELSALISSLEDENSLLYIEIPILWSTITWIDSFFMAHKNNFTIETLKRFLTNFEVEVLSEGWENTESVNENYFCTIKRSTQKYQFKNDVIINEDYLKSVRKLYFKDAPSEVRTSQLNFSVENIENFFFIRKFSDETQINNDGDFITVI